MKNLNYQQKIEKLKNITSDTLENLTGNKEELRKFLRFQAKLYKYSFEDTISIYSQKPHATACATMDDWNKIGRRVNRGAKATYTFADNSQKGMKKVFDLESTNGREFTYPINFEIPALHRQKLLQFLGTDFPHEVIDENFDDIFKFSIADHIHNNYENYFDNFQYDKKGTLVEFLNDVELNKSFKNAVLECATFMICEKFGIPHEEFNRNNMYFDEVNLFNSKVMLTHIAHMANYISKNIITNMNITLKNERRNENESKSEYTRNESNERGIHVRGEHEKTPMEIFRPQLRTSERISYENSGRTNETINRVGRERNQHGVSVGGESRTGIRGETDAIGFIRENVPNVYGGQPPKQEIASNVGRRMERYLPGGEQASGRNGGTTGYPIYEQIPAPINVGLLDSFKMGNIEERLDRGNNFEPDRIREEINYTNWLKEQKAKEPFYNEGSFLNEKSPYVVIESSESDLFEDGETLLFSSADYKFKEVEKQYREQRLENGQNGGYKKTRGTIFYQENADDVEMSSYAFRYDIGDYDEQQSGLYNHINNFWNNVEKRLQEQAVTGQWQPYTQDDINQVRNTLSILKPFAFEVIAETGFTEIERINEQEIPFINVMIVEPNKTPYLTVMQNDFLAFEEKVGSIITSIEIDDDISIICAENADYEKNTLDRFISDTPIYETFIITRVDDLTGEYISLNEEDVIKYKQIFSNFAEVEEQPNISTPSIEPVEKVSPNPMFFSNFRDIEASIDFNNYKNGDVIGYNIEGVKYQVGKMGNTNYITTTTSLTSWGDVLGSDNIPNDILEQMQNYRKGSILQQPLPQDNSNSIETNNILSTTQETNNSAANFIITDKTDIGLSSGKTKFNENIEAIKLLKTLDVENRNATSEEQYILAKFSGFGGIPQAFDEHNSGWSNEYRELKNLLPEERYELAQGSTLNAHYTSTEVISAMYNGLERLGFKGGNILEPSMGIGNFFGMLPNKVKDNSRLYGVELDETTGKLAKQLYPKANIQISGFEKADFQDNFFDVAIGNVPFGNYRLNDAKFNKYNFLIHDYFIAKALDKVKPEGVIAVITSKGTMDKESTTFRQYLAERAELLGAIRLPNTAFKESAGTAVTSDILFLKKRSAIAYVDDERWVKTGQLFTDTRTEQGDNETIMLNQYFIDNPQMMLGKMVNNMGQFGHETALLPFSLFTNDLSFEEKSDLSLEELLSEAITFLPKNIMEEVNLVDSTELLDLNKTIPADPSVKNYCHVVVDGEIFQRENSIMKKIDIPAKEFGRLESLINLRDITRELLNIQLKDCSSEELKDGQAKLNTAYDTFYKKYGSIKSKINAKYFKEDADYPLLHSLETEDEEKNISKAGIFTERTVSPIKRIDKVETSTEALAVSLNEYGYINLPAMNELLKDKTVEEIISDLQGVIFKNPFDDNFTNEFDILENWETADEYLSGNVVEKLKMAKKSAEENPIYSQNVQALEIVQPIPLEAQDITVKLGTSWVDKAYYKQFIEQLLKPNRYDKLEVNQSSFSSTWYVEKPVNRSYSIEATERFGTKRMDAYELIENMLNQKSPRIYDTVSYTDDNGNSREKRVLNKAETIAIKSKQTIVKQEFKDWIYKDPTRREVLVAKYNEKFNSTRQRAYNGEHISFDGMNPSISLRKHQADGIARILYGGNTLLAHVVGAGKTYTMIAAAMEMKRLGLANKPCIVVPKHLVMQWSNDFKKLYPTANVLATSEKDFEKKNRQRFCAKIATGNWDAVIMSHSQFEKIPMSQERQERRLNAEITQIREALIELSYEKDQRLTVKELQRQLKTQEFKLEKLYSTPRDNLVTFEQTGIDALSVDEAHGFKNKFMFTKMNNIAGLAKTSSMKSSDMDMKCEYINELNQASNKNSKAVERGVCFATGTPISNSVVEMYTMQSYLQRGELKRLGLSQFDNWASNFGETVSSLELAPSGQGFRIRDRFAKFVNLPELMGLYRQVADIQTAEMVDLPVPKIKGDKAITISVEPSPDQIAIVDDCVKRSEAMAAGGVNPADDNMLCVVNDGRKGALDPRTINPDAEDYEFSKVNTCVKNIFDIYKKTDVDKLTQMVFCDSEAIRYCK